jgi:drug/metabolite transporter (DMT)-like permease
MFASIFGYLLAGDRLKPMQILGGVFILTGILTGEVLAAIQQQNRK